MIKKSALVILFIAAVLLSNTYAGGYLYETSFEEGKDAPKGWTHPPKKENWQ